MRYTAFVKGRNVSIDTQSMPMSEKNNPDNQPGGMTLLTKSFIENNRFLKRFVSRFLSGQQDIEDVVQETYLRAYSASSDRDIEQPKAFLFRIAKNIALNELTRKSRQITDYIEDCSPSSVIDHGVSVEEEIQARQTLGIYCEALATLPEKCRKVYLLRKVHGLSHQEIAERMELTVSSVEKYLTRGMLHCKAYMEKSEQPQRATGKPVANVTAFAKERS